MRVVSAEDDEICCTAKSSCSRRLECTKSPPPYSLRSLTLLLRLYLGQFVSHSLSSNFRPVSLPLARFFSEYLSSSKRHVLQISPLRQSDFGQWACSPDLEEDQGDKGDEDKSNDIVPQESHGWNLVVLPSVERPYVFQTISPEKSAAKLDTWDIFRREGQRVRVVEHEALQLYCAVLVRKSRVQHQAKKGRTKHFLRWETDSPDLDLGAQVTYEYFVQNEDQLLGFLSVLTVYGVDRAAHGSTLKCAAGGEGVEFSLQVATVTVGVDYPPTFTLRRTPGFGIPVEQGMTISLACDADVRPKMIGRWLKDEKALNSTSNGIVIIDKASADDVGWYQCSINYNGEEYSSIAYYLNVKVDPEQNSEAQPEVALQEEGEEAVNSAAVQNAPKQVSLRLYFMFN